MACFQANLDLLLIMTGIDHRPIGEERGPSLWFYLLALLVPLMGLAMTIFYMRRPQPRYRRITRNCLIVAFIEPFVLLAAVLLIVYICR